MVTRPISRATERLRIPARDGTSVQTKKRDDSDARRIAQEHRRRPVAGRDRSKEAAGEIGAAAEVDHE